MKRWLAVLALVPVVAWGGCYSTENRLYYLEYAQTVIDVRDKGRAENEVLATVTHGDLPSPLRASMLTAVEIAYSHPGAGPSLIARRMAQACDEEVQRMLRYR